MRTTSRATRAGKSFKWVILTLAFLLIIPACRQEQAGRDVIQLTILYTNDEHGWMAGMEEGKGAAELTGLWDTNIVGGDDSILILSGGDNWTGPAISTWFYGESMVEVMNAMGYDASVIGNHEFDFGLDILEKRLAQASYPYLSANIRYKKDGSVPTDLGIQPYTLFETNGLKVGIIGLTTTTTPSTTNPKNVASFEFLDYRSTLNDLVPTMREEGADLIIVASHVCKGELARLAWQVNKLDIPVMGGGHCHELVAQQISNTVILSGGSSLASYAYLHMTIDPVTKEIIDREFGTSINQGGKADAEIAQIVNHWQARTDAELNVVIGHLSQAIPPRSQKMMDLITETWLISDPNADIAVTNLGGIRDSLPAGDITLADIISVMPFDNTLVKVRLNGEQVLSILSRGKNPVVGGLHNIGGQWVLNKTGEALERNTIYTMLVNDFMYAGGDGYSMLAKFDPDAYDTSISWRDPVIDWIRNQRSSSEEPLDIAIERLATR